MDYVALRKDVVEAGLLNRQYGYYALKFIITFGTLALSYLLLATVDSFVFQLFNAAFLAFAIVQVGYIMHDAIHMQIFSDKRKNDFAGILTGALTVNVSSSWADAHLLHHKAPNHADLDPDVKMPILAFSEEQALQKKGLATFLVKHQAFIWFPLLTSVAFIMRFGNTVTLVKNIRGKRWKFHLTEAVFLLAGCGLYFGVILNSLSFTQAIVFLLVSNVLTGLYMGTSFATNHKAMPLMKESMTKLSHSFAQRNAPHSTYQKTRQKYQELLAQYVSNDRYENLFFIDLDGNIIFQHSPSGKLYNSKIQTT